MAQSCIAADLLAASKCLCGIPSGKRELVMIYLLQQLAGLGNLTAAQLLDRAKCLCGLSERDMKAIEVALLCTATGGVPPCPPCPPSGGCTYQDMQVAWTPTSAKLGEKIGFYTDGDWGNNPLGGITSLTFSQATTKGDFYIRDTTDLVTIDFPNILTIFGTANASNDSTDRGLLIKGNSALTSVSAPLLQTLDTSLEISGNPILITVILTALISADAGIQSNAGQIVVSANSLLTNLSLPAWVPTNGGTYVFADNNLSAASVNSLLASAVANAGFVSGLIDLSNTTGTNAAPTGQGIIDKATLNGRQAGLAVTA